MPLSLVEQLLSYSTDMAIPATNLLRLGKLAAVRLKLDDFTAKIDYEMEGYLPAQQVPAYRHLTGQVQWHQRGRGWQNMPIDNPQLPFPNPLAEIVTLLSQDDSFFALGLPQALEFDFARVSGLDLRFLTSRSSMGGVVEGVRNAIFNWALALDQAGAKGEEMKFTPAEATAAHSVKIENIFHRSVGGVAQSGGFISGTIGP
jgi:hypothetical protein